MMYFEDGGLLFIDLMKILNANLKIFVKCYHSPEDCVSEVGGTGGTL